MKFYSPETWLNLPSLSLIIGSGRMAMCGDFVYTCIPQRFVETICSPARSKIAWFDVIGELFSCWPAPGAKPIPWASLVNLRPQHGLDTSTIILASSSSQVAPQTSNVDDACGERCEYGPCSYSALGLWLVLLWRKRHPWRTDNDSEILHSTTHRLSRQTAHHEIVLSLDRPRSVDCLADGHHPRA